MSVFPCCVIGQDVFVTPTQCGLLSPHLPPSSNQSPPCPGATSIPLPTGSSPRLSYGCYPWLLLKKESQSYHWNNTHLLPRSNKPTDFQAFKKGRAPLHRGRRRWAAKPDSFWHISYHSPTGLVCLYIFPSPPQTPIIFVFQNSLTIFTEACETQGTAKQQSPPPPSNELNNHKLSSAPKSSEQTESSQPLSSSVVWAPGHQPDSHKAAGSHSEKHLLSPCTSSWAQTQGFLWLCQTWMHKILSFLENKPKRSNFTSKLSKLSPRKGRSNF